MKNKLIYQSIGVGLLLVMLGLFLASRKQLWTDELFTQRNIEKTSFAGLLQGNLGKDEGNPCPLYYFLQKTFFGMIQYRFPIPWKGEYCIADLQSQMIIRLTGIVYMALGTTLIFFIFARDYSLKTGIMALLLALSNPMFWLYIAEARPYGLWFLLTVIQIIIILGALRRGDAAGWWLALAACHLCLGMTIVFTFLQIAVFSCVFWYISRVSWKKMALVLLLPVVVIYFYYKRSVTQFGWISSDISANIMSLSQKFIVNVGSYLTHFFSTPVVTNIPWPWIIVLVLAGLGMFKGNRLRFKLMPQAQVCVWSLIVLLLMSTVLIEFISIVGANGVQDDVASRYFIFLFAHAVFALMFIYVNVKEIMRDPWARRILNAVYAGTIITSFLLSLVNAARLGIYY